MKILVTGASGFIGKHLVRRLVEKHKVKCLVRESSNVEELKKLKVELVYGGLLDKKSLANAVKNVDVVYHLAAVLGSKAEDKKDIWDANVEGTRNIIDAACKAKVSKFVHFSTFLVYGYTDEPATEETPYTAETTFYGKSKRKSEEVVKEYSDKIKTVIIQPTIIHGEGLDFGFSSLFPAIQNGKFMFIGNGENLQHLGYIENFIEGALLAGEKKEAVGKKYIIGDEAPITFNLLVENIADILNVKASKVHLNEKIARMSVFPLKILSKLTNTNPLLDNKRINFMVNNQAGNISKIKKELGYKPKISSRDGLEKTIEYYKKTGFLR
ncbi:MAG: hypothetical protein CMH62_02525 [Nanoarchaeota archaeon]|nr:hypothetical protein [Nanoarchaeota archaeon]